MLQYLLLLVEFLLLGATAYIYWNTRRVVENSAAPAPLTQPGWVQNQANVAQMTQDVAALVTDLQSVAGATRDDLLKQRVELQLVLKQAETLADELRALINQVDTDPALPHPAAVVELQPAPVAESEPDQPLVMMTAPAEPPVAPAPTKTKTDSPGLVPLDLVYSAAHFGEFLYASGCGSEVVTLASAHAQEFVIWFTNQFKKDEPTPRHIAPYYLDKYANYLQAQQFSLDTINRRFIALKAYLNWINNLAQDNEVTPPPAPVSSHAGDPHSERQALLGPAQPPEEPAAPKTDRYRTVLSLAEEGLDQLAIAAKTGLEQEAVRMMLLMNQTAYTSS